ncbi:MAG: tetratricopeptide repeat protein [Stigonema ocellatum SAG 48.90 = DSM 106950]|nr:tetratricopeptide repeat protein [Stigonema ocellatum SAG 48.90 = DSM 106950]
MSIMKKIITTTLVLIASGLSATDILQPVQATPSAKSSLIQDQKAFEHFSSSADHDFGLTLMSVGAILAFCSTLSLASKALNSGKKSNSQDKPGEADKPRAIKDSTLYGNKQMMKSGYLEQAYTALRQGDAQRAIAQLNDAIRLHPNDAYVYTERANFRHKNLGDREGALKDYTQAINLHPENALLYLWRCQLYNEIGEQLKAMADYNTAIRLAPENTMYHFFQTNFNSARR